MGTQGDTIDGRYVLGEQLGRGGMGEVFRATDTNTDRAVALKVLTSTEPGSAQRFRSEADLLTLLDHPGVVRLRGSGFHDGVPYLVLDLADGPSLARELADGPLDLGRMRRVGSEIADALAHAHDHGVVHRDVKPSNVLFAADGRARLADFGIARLAGAQTLTRTGQLVGTAPYLAPEQVAGDEVGPAADVYALGLVLAECLTGRPCFPGTQIEAALSRLHRPPPLPPDVPAWLRQVLAAMTAREPAARPPARMSRPRSATPTSVRSWSTRRCTSDRRSWSRHRPCRGQRPCSRPTRRRRPSPRIGRGGSGHWRSRGSPSRPSWGCCCGRARAATRPPSPRRPRR